jgi:hypothetical protein
LNNGVKRVHYLNGKTQFFDFGPDVVAGEPVFAARPGAGLDKGWLIVQCLDGRSPTGFVCPVRRRLCRCRANCAHQSATRPADQLSWLVESCLSDASPDEFGDQASPMWFNLNARDVDLPRSVRGPSCA